VRVGVDTAGLDSEGGYQRVMRERPFRRWVASRANVRMKRWVGSEHRVLKVATRSVAAPLIPHEYGDAKRYGIAAFVRCDDTGAIGFVVIALGRGYRVWIAPGDARHPGARPERDTQHNRQDSCSSHVSRPGSRSRKNTANRTAPRRLNRRRFTVDAQRWASQLCGILARWRGKFLGRRVGRFLPSRYYYYSYEAARSLTVFRASAATASANSRTAFQSVKS
jgi:hypothetical protein